MHRVLISGATSFLGRELAERLMATGIETHAIVRPETDLGLLDGLSARPVLHVHGDGPLDSILAAAAPDVVFHLAGRYVRDHAPDDVEMLLRDNVVFASQLLDATVRAGCRTFVNTGTYFQFAGGTSTPQPLNLYAAAKQAFLTVLDYYRDAFGLRAATLVIFDTYGSGDRRVRLMSAIRDAQQAGTELPVPADDPLLDLVHSDDVADAFLCAAGLLADDPAAVDGGLFALSSGERRRISQVVAAFEEVGGKPVRTRAGGWPKPARAVSTLWDGPALPGWQPKIRLADGIRRLIEGT